jgi:hypothetical protein
MTVYRRSSSHAHSHSRYGPAIIAAIGRAAADPEQPWTLKRVTDNWFTLAWRPNGARHAVVGGTQMLITDPPHSHHQASTHPAAK